MARKRHKPEEIVTKLRQVEVLHGQGRRMVDAIRQIGVSEVTFYRIEPDIGQADPERGRQGKLLSPSRRRHSIDHVRKRLGVLEGRTCRVLDQHRSTQRRIPQGRADEDRLVADMIEMARQYGRYGYRRIAALLRQAGWQVNDKQIERL